MKYFVFLILFSALLILPSFAFPNSSAIGIELFFSSPKLSLDLPINNNEPIEFGFSPMAPTMSVYFLDYRKQLYSDENSRYTLNMGAALINEFGIAFFAPSNPKPIILPLLAIEHENIISKGISFSIKAGFPELLSIGLRYYL